MGTKCVYVFLFLSLFCPSWSCTIICCINSFISLCKNLFNLLEFLADFRCHVTVKHWKWCTWHRKASAKNSSKLNKFLHSEVNLLMQHIPTFLCGWEVVQRATNYQNVPAGVKSKVAPISSNCLINLMLLVYIFIAMFLVLSNVFCGK